MGEIATFPYPRTSKSGSFRYNFPILAKNMFESGTLGSLKFPSMLGLNYGNLLSIGETISKEFCLVSFCQSNRCDMACYSQFRFPACDCGEDGLRQQSISLEVKDH